MTLTQRSTECFLKRTAITATPKTITFDRIRPCNDPITMKWDTKKFFSTPPMCNAIIVVAKSASWRKMNVSCVIRRGFCNLAKRTLYHDTLQSGFQIDLQIIQANVIAVSEQFGAAAAG